MVLFLIVVSGFRIFFMKPVEILQVTYLDDYETLRINFNSSIILNDNTVKNIKIIDSDGNNIPLSYQLAQDSMNLVLKPYHTNYALGEQYTLIIDYVQGQWFGNLNKPIKETFEIDKLPVDKSLGLGEFMTKKVSNDRAYSWYVDQGDTGEFSSTNCGPASAEMVGKWVDEDFKGTAEEARELDYCDDNGWFTENIKNYLHKYKIESKIIPNVSKEMMVFNLEDGNIMVLGVKIGGISLNDPSDNSEHTGRFYLAEGGHFIIVKGYVVVDGVTYFEVYDPNSWYNVYEDGTPMGKDRYFLADEVINASKVWYDELLLISFSLDNTLTSK